MVLGNIQMVQLYSFIGGYPLFLETFIERLPFPHWMVLAHLSKIIWPHTWGFIPELFILFCWSIHLSLCQHHPVLITVNCSKFWNQQVLFLKFASYLQDCFGSSGSLESSYEFQDGIFLSLQKKCESFLRFQVRA